MHGLKERPNELYKKSSAMAELLQWDEAVIYPSTF